MVEFLNKRSENLSAQFCYNCPPGMTWVLPIYILIADPKTEYPLEIYLYRRDCHRNRSNHLVNVGAN